MIFSFNFTEAGTYPVSLRLMNQYGCYAQHESDVVVHPTPVASFESGEVCLSTPFQFVNTSTVSSGEGMTYWWSFGDKETSTSKNPVHKYQEAGEYAVYLQAITEHGCEHFVVNKINVLEEPFADFTYKKFKYDTELNETVYQFTAQENNPGSVITWYLNGTQVRNGVQVYMNFGDTGTINITMIAENGVGCPATSSRSVFVAPPFEYYIPTSFTPNEDGINDVFKPVGENYIAEYEMVILNRWGMVMFKTNDPEQGWDGMYAGQLAPTEMYAYIIRIKDIEGAEWKYEGTVLLLNPGSF